jgi:hypothetical protein
MEKIITFILVILLVWVGLGYAQNVQVRVSNARPKPGDIIYLEYTYPTRPTNVPKSLWSYMASIHLDGRYRNGYLYSYVYEIRAFQAGLLTIPSFAVQSEGRQVYSPNVEIPIGVKYTGK